jgi:hypothetical protein
MGIKNLFKQFVSQEALGDQTIDSVVIIFNKAQKARPYEDLHESLASTWMHRMKAMGHNVNDQNMVLNALSETYLHACVRPPLCARSLGLYFLYKENPQIIQKYPKFSSEYNKLIEPVFEAQENGTIDELYKRYNPKMAKNSQD